MLGRHLPIAFLSGPLASHAPIDKNATVMEKKRRRWLRFGLRGMFILVTALCGWLAWETSVVRARRAALNELGKDQSIQVTTAEAWIQRYPPGAPVPDAATVPSMRRWLGDEAIQEIWYGAGMQPIPEEELRRLASLFPEAELREALYPPCHPGCFPLGTLVDTPRGERPIDRIAAGDVIITIQAEGEPSAAEVQSVFVTENRLWKVETEAGCLFTTQTQPLCLADGAVTPAGELRSGDRILRRENGDVRAVTVHRVSQTDRIENVYNVILGDSQTFVAESFLARSKPPASP
jgi:hypothetical protein